MSIVYFIYLLCTFMVILSYPATASDENPPIKSESVTIIKNDMPSFIDLMVYIPLLNRLVEFCERHKEIFSVNLMHGLFLISVNLGPFVKDGDIPQALRRDLEKMITRSEKLQAEYHSSMNSILQKLLSALASNATAWSHRVKKLNYDLLKKTLSHGEYPLWHKYLKAIEDIHKGLPTPPESDKCVTSLVESEENLSNDTTWLCELPNDCYKAIINGTDFGYWLTHRLILLLHARLSRNCAIFSPHEDELYRLQLCERAYREAEYIALNGFQLVDLLLEQMAICSLDGHAQFLRRSWLTSILDYQQTGGCFQLYKVDPRYKEDVKDCNQHVIGVALAAYAAAVRLILENMKQVIE